MKLQDTGESATLLGIGPMSPNLLQASFEIGEDYDFPLMFIASRIRLMRMSLEAAMSMAESEAVS